MSAWGQGTLVTVSSGETALCLLCPGLGGHLQRVLGPCGTLGGPQGRLLPRPSASPSCGNGASAGGTQSGPSGLHAQGRRDLGVGLRVGPGGCQGLGFLYTPQRGPRHCGYTGPWGQGILVTVSSVITIVWTSGAKGSLSPSPQVAEEGGDCRCWEPKPAGPGEGTEGSGTQWTGEDRDPEEEREQEAQRDRPRAQPSCAGFLHEVP
ncbi:hypothetical protein J1605_011781 [Eschrichtius robustus]|uniref:Uncharacterized protein n=1 Tax=Eschrichtius robustus TaxID=9764 RepID=A0AB34GLK8_ESCRO|nr:hypothetical protein J1605_011781 [Eschrichtius robustus]